MPRPEAPNAFALHGGQAEQGAAKGMQRFRRDRETVRRTGTKRKFETRQGVSLQRRLSQEMFDERAMILD